jgi:hypothetical protein
VLNVSVEVFDVASVMLTPAGLNPAVTPAGSGDALRFTRPVNPASGVTVAVYCAWLPGTTFLVDGEMLIAKSGVVDAGEDATNVR